MAFKGAGRSVGLEIWRIEDFEAVAYDKSKYGKFHIGDSYIVLSTTEKNKGRLTWNVHFWLGSETSLDEAGTAAIKTIELDDELGGSPVQHREVQEHESQMFLSYFKQSGGVKYLPGGVVSGFTHVDPDDVEKRMFQVKGKRNIKVKQVALDASSMNKSDCFILDCGKGHDILVFMPPGARKMEKYKAIEAANQIRDEDHAGDAKIEIIDEFSGSPALFFEMLGSGCMEDLPEDSGEEDVAAERHANQNVTLYKVSGEGNDIQINEVATKPLTQDLLKSEDCFILNTGSTNGIFAWIGKHATREERIQAMKSAEAFLAKNDLPKYTKIERVVDGGEPTMFKQYFTMWRENYSCPTTCLGRVYPIGSVAEWDVASLHAEVRRRLARNAGSAIGFMPDDGQGTKEVYRIEDFELVPVAHHAVGTFFGGDSYVIKYSYQKEEGRAYIVYFWQGGQSSQDEKAASAMNAVKMDNALGGKAIQIRVTQGKEPRHFIKMFHGKMVVFMGGKASGFNNIHDHDTYDIDGTRLFHVRGTCAEDIRAVQVPEVASSLNSEDVFVLETPSNTYIWHGQASSEEEKVAGNSIVEIVSPGRSPQIVDEYSEPDEFWSAIGGKGDYSKSYENRPILEPRLFHCRIMPSGKMIATEIHDFEQKDLMSDDVMILDSGDELYVWIGSESSDVEREKAFSLAKDYLSTDPTERDDSNTVVFTVKQGEEPSSFTCLFPSFSN